MTWGQSLLENYTDAMVVLHRGRCIDERYLGVMDAHRLHMGMSITKSFTGLLAAQLAHEGELDVHRPVTHYLPELAQSAYATATVDQVMDMRIGVRYSENYADPEADIWRHARAGGVFPPRPGDPAPQGFRAFLCGLPPEGEHGKGFAYKTVNTDVLGWVMHRITGSDVGTLLQNRIWQALGAEHDAAMGVDDWGTDFAGGGLNCTVRDLARFGEMMRCAGHSHDRQVVAESVVADIAGGGDQEAFQAGGYATLTNWSYRRMWWVSHNDHGAYMARGIHGQSLYIDPRAELVIARFGSHPVAGNVFNDPVTLPAFHALAQALMA
jgi:CubicO group peptidase (beta-lactamase class C family)